VVRRRALLGAGAAALLAGCGDGDSAGGGGGAEARGDESTLADAALLDDALAYERRAAEALADDGAAAALRRRARSHVDLLARLIRERRGEPRPLAPREDAGSQEELVALYVDMVAKLSEPALRGVAGGLLADAAGAAAQLRFEAGEDPAPEPFVAGVRPEERGR
jgi:hypothetical protein